MSENYFKFKQFTVFQDNVACKVGTDGVLIAAWADVENADFLLDVGTGSGVTALICAQRSHALITALELDGKTAEAAQKNFDISPFNNRINLINDDFCNADLDFPHKFDYIISNPPYFNNSLKSSCLQRNFARHTDSLSYDNLARGVAKFLSSDGTFSLVLPFAESQNFINISRFHHLYLKRFAAVKSLSSKPPLRALMSFGFDDLVKVEKEEICIYSQPAVYSDYYKKITKDFYLNF